LRNGHIEIADLFIKVSKTIITPSKFSSAYLIKKIHEIQGSRVERFRWWKQEKAVRSNELHIDKNQRARSSTSSRVLRSS